MIRSRLEIAEAALQGTLAMDRAGATRAERELGARGGRLIGVHDRGSELGALQGSRRGLGIDHGSERFEGSEPSGA